MKIIIDIDEYDYNNLMLYKNHPVGLHWLEQKIITGTPLPKGHGKLKDMGNLKYVFDLTKDNPIYSGKDIERAIKSMTTIIEAESEE